MVNYVLNTSFTCNITSENTLFISVAGMDGIEYTENIDFYSSILELINNKYPKTIFIQKLKEKGGASIILCKWFFPTADCF